MIHCSLWCTQLLCGESSTWAPTAAVPNPENDFCTFLLIAPRKLLVHHPNTTLAKASNRTRCSCHSSSIPWLMRPCCLLLNKLALLCFKKARELKLSLAFVHLDSLAALYYTPTQSHPPREAHQQHPEAVLPRLTVRP